MRISRRTVLTGMVAAAVLGRPGTAAADVPAQLNLPRPTGPFPVGTRGWHLIDRTRADPWYPARRREVMAQLWYPAHPRPCAPRAEYVSPAVSRALVRGPEATPPELPDDVYTRVRVHAVECAPARSGRRPLVLVSPGHGTCRSSLTSLCEDIASRGFVVAAIDHPSDAAAVEFPDGRVVTYQKPRNPADEETRYLNTRTADTRFVLDWLLGGSPVSRIVDPSRVGMFGHSLGGATAAEVMRLDERVRVGANLDGSQHGEVVTTGLDRPFLLWQLGPEDGGHTNWQQLWANLRGWRRFLYFDGAGHMTCTDHDAFLEPLRLRERYPADVYRWAFGVFPGGYGIRVNRAYVAALLDHHLHDRPQPLLNRPSSRFPEVRFLGR